MANKSRDVSILSASGQPFRAAQEGGEQRRHAQYLQPQLSPSASKRRYGCMSDNVDDCATAFITYFRQQLEQQHPEPMEKHGRQLRANRYS